MFGYNCILLQKWLPDTDLSLSDGLMDKVGVDKA